MNGFLKGVVIHDIPFVNVTEDVLLLLHGSLEALDLLKPWIYFIISQRAQPYVKIEETISEVIVSPFVEVLLKRLVCLLLAFQLHQLRVEQSLRNKTRQFLLAN